MHQRRTESETGSPLYGSFEEMHEAVMTVRLQRRRLQVQAKLRNEAPPNWEILLTSYRWVISECNIDLKWKWSAFGRARAVDRLSRRG
jgi:hypothetical protein